MIGIYENNTLIKSLESKEQVSEFLPKALQDYLKDFDFEALIYANGPGSYMGIKISFLALKTLSISKDIPLFAVSAFELNHYKPIKANKNFCFVYDNGNISLAKAEAGEFFLPKNLQDLKLKQDNLPFYFLGAI